MELKSARDSEGNEIMAIKLNATELIKEHTCAAIVGKIAQLVAEKYVADNYQEIVKHISPEAVATLTAAESAAKIRESLEKSIPSKVLEIIRTDKEVWQRGVFGGMSRIR